MAPSDANGNYSLPAGYLAVTGTTVLASQHNPPLEDIAESMTNRIMASGVKPFSGPAKHADGTVSAPGITMASATSSGWYKTADGWGFSIGGVMVAELTSGGLRTGGMYVGMIFDWTGSTAPSLCVLPYGQTLSRTSYARLWDFAQIEIAAGNTLYNNGNGSTTFGIPDMRGRVRATKDNMGGSAASRLTSTYFGTSANTLGAAGGSESHTLVEAQLPSLTKAATRTTDVALSINYRKSAFQTGGFTGMVDMYSGTDAAQNATITPSIITQPNFSVSFGSGGAHNNVQPTIITNCALYAGD